MVLLYRDISPNYGFTAIIVAFLGRLHPLGILFAALVIALTYLGAEDAQLFMQIPAAVGFVFQGLVLFYLLGAELLVNYKLVFINSMNIDLIIGIINIVLIATTPLVFAGIGELVTEKTGVLNLGVEGMMLVGAVTAFVTLVITGSYILAFLFSIISGLFMSGLFAYLVLGLMSNQVATGLALTIFGIGLSSMIGKEYIGTPIKGLDPYFFIILSFAIVFATNYFFYKTKMGLIFRAVGESHSSAHALGL